MPAKLIEATRPAAQSIKKSTPPPKRPKPSVRRNNKEQKQGKSPAKTENSKDRVKDRLKLFELRRKSFAADVNTLGIDVETTLGGRDKTRTRIFKPLNRGLRQQFGLSAGRRFLENCPSLLLFIV